MAPMNTDHHHRSTTKGSNKPFKSRHSTKSALKEKSKGKVEMLEKGARKTPHQQVMSKFERKNHAKQVRQNKLGERREEASVFQGKDGAPRIVAVIPLCADVKSNEVIMRMNGSVDVEEERPSNEGPWRVEIPRFKQKVQYLTPSRALFACLDAARIADFVLFVLSAEEEVDEVGEQILRCIEGQGVSTVLTGVHNLDKVEPAKKRPDVAKSLKSFIAHFFNEQEKVHDLSSRQDCSNAMRSLCTTVPKGIRWREDRSWLLPEDVRWEDNTPVVTGTVRGKGLKADRLVQVGEWGDFQVDRITAAPLETRNKRTKTSEMAVDSAEGGEQTLEEPSEEQDDMAELAPEEATMDDDGMSMAPTSMAPSERKHVLLDDHRYFDEEEKGVDALPRPKRLPRGTSKSQAVWYLGGQYDDDSGSDMEDVEPEDELDGDMDIMDAAGSTTGPPGEGDVGDADMMEEGAPSEYPQSEMFDDAAPEDEAEQIAAYRKQRRDEAEDDLEFPDEIELHPHVNARERLARYRGLKNLRTSHWETEEDRPYEPEDWSRLLEVADYKSAKNRMLKDALSGGVKAGTRVNIYLCVDSAQVEALKALPTPTAVISLLKHEHKQTAVNASMSLSSEYPEPLKSKEELIIQCGPRRLLINPLFSQAGNTPNDVHKFDRYIHPGRT
ncbi:putative pre-rRNA processing protein Tsr1, partial [Hortaea werneckii]